MLSLTEEVSATPLHQTFPARILRTFITAPAACQRPFQSENRGHPKVLCFRNPGAQALALPGCPGQAGEWGISRWWPWVVVIRAT